MKSKLPKKPQHLLAAPKKTLKESRPFFEDIDKDMTSWKKRYLPDNVFIFFALALLVSGLIFVFILNYIVNIQYQKPANLFLAGPVTTPPKSLLIDLQQPDDNLLVFDSSLVISGKTAPYTEVLLTTDTRDLVLISKPDGTFSTVLNLEEGVNRIVVIVFDATGDKRSAERTVYYSKEKI